MRPVLRNINREGDGQLWPAVVGIAVETMQEATQSVAIRPARNVLGSLRVPGDKSISHRYAMLAALADGRSRFDNFAPGADCASTLACVRRWAARSSATKGSRYASTDCGR